MTDILRCTILGCGSSPGVPRITGDWGACDPREPKNRRRRSSALVERLGKAGRTTVVIDCGPDFREQMLAAAVTKLDAILLTHAHADHIHGLDDVRGYMLQQRQLIPVYADEPTFARVFEAFGYCFETPAGSEYPPIVRHVGLRGRSPVVIDGDGGSITVLPFEQQHGSIRSLGFRIGPLAYCSDVSDFDQGAVEAVRGAQHIILDALQYRPHPSHLSVEQALDWLGVFAPERATLTHMHTPLDYATLAAELPPHVRPAYDGLQLDFRIE